MGENLDSLHDLDHQQDIKEKYSDRLCIFGSIVQARFAESLLKTFYCVPDQLHDLVSNDHQSKPEKDHRYDSFKTICKLYHGLLLSNLPIITVRLF